MPLIDLLIRAREDLAVVEACRSDLKGAAAEFDLTDSELEAISAGGERLSSHIWAAAQADRTASDPEPGHIDLRPNPPPAQTGVPLNVHIPPAVRVVPVLTRPGPEPERLTPPQRLFPSGDGPPDKPRPRPGWLTPPPEASLPGGDQSFTAQKMGADLEDLARRFRESTGDEGFEAALALVEGLYNERYSTGRKLLKTR